MAVVSVGSHSWCLLSVCVWLSAIICGSLYLKIIVDILRSPGWRHIPPENLHFILATYPGTLLIQVYITIWGALGALLGSHQREMQTDSWLGARAPQEEPPPHPLLSMMDFTSISPCPKGLAIWGPASRHQCLLLDSPPGWVEPWAWTGGPPVWEGEVYSKADTRAPCVSLWVASSLRFWPNNYLLFCQLLETLKRIFKNFIQ